MTEYDPSLCRACTRLDLSHPVPGLPPSMPRTCAAYPSGIPTDILRGADHHTLRGDETEALHFEQADSDDAARAFSWWSKAMSVRSHMTLPPDAEPDDLVDA